MNALLLIASFVVFGSARALQNPNIILIVVDDLGTADVSLNPESLIPTPNFDRLARQGALLNRYYVQPLCSPTRATLMTGRYAHHTGIYDVIRPGTTEALPSTSMTLPEHLRKAGYETAAIGKWHLGSSRWADTPTGRGFDSHYGYFGGDEDYYSKVGCKRSGWGGHPPPKSEQYDGLDFWDNKEPLWSAQGPYSLDQYMERATQILEKRAAMSKPLKPLFMYFAHQTVHAPVEDLGEKSYIERCLAAGNANGTYAEQMRLKFCAMLVKFDDSLQDFEHLLRKTGHWENTLLVVTTDNGGSPVIPKYVQKLMHYDDPYIIGAGCNYPLAGGKSSTWEGGIKAVGFVNGGFLPKHARGQQRTNLMHSTDWLPTILSAAGLRNETSTDVDPIDGVDQWPAISHGANTTREAIPIANGIKFPPTLIQWPFKLIQGKNLWRGHVKCKTQTGLVPMFFDNTYLFNLDEDPTESTNLARKMPDKVEQLLHELQKINATAVPHSDTTYSNASHTANFNGVCHPWRE